MSAISGLDGLAAALSKSTPAVEKAVAKVVRKSAKTLQDEARSLISGQITGTYLPHYAASITFDMVGQLAAEVGPDAGRPQGGMGRGVEFGSAKHGPLAHMIPAADKVEPDFAEDVATAAVKATL